MEAGVKIPVQTYAGRKADERPVRFEVEGLVYTVEGIVDQWREPDGAFFKVRADDGNLYTLRHGRDDQWTLEPFRQP